MSSSTAAGCEDGCFSIRGLRAFQNRFEFLKICAIRVLSSCANRVSRGEKEEVSASLTNSERDDLVLAAALHLHQLHLIYRSLQHFSVCRVPVPAKLTKTETVRDIGKTSIIHRRTNCYKMFTFHQSAIRDHQPVISSHRPPTNSKKPSCFE